MKYIYINVLLVNLIRKLGSCLPERSCRSNRPGFPSPSFCTMMVPILQCLAKEFELIIPYASKTSLVMMILNTVRLKILWYSTIF